MKVVIELYLPDDQEINDVNVGRALGEAIMTNQLHYKQIISTTNDKEDTELLVNAMMVYK